MVLSGKWKSNVQQDALLSARLDYIYALGRGM